MTKINLRITAKPHAHFQILREISAKLKKNMAKVIGGVAFTRYALVEVEAKVQTAKKVTKINLTIIAKPHAHLQTLTKTPEKCQKIQLTLKVFISFIY